MGLINPRFDRRPVSVSQERPLFSFPLKTALPGRNFSVTIWPRSCGGSHLYGELMEFTEKDDNLPLTRVPHPGKIGF
jgi:hypothetical protein